MEKLYAIAWQERTGGKYGVGKKLLDQAEAEQLALELNRDYPDYCHVAVNTAVEITPAFLTTLYRITALPEKMPLSELGTSTVEVTP